MSVSLEIVGSILSDYKRDHGLRPAAPGHIPANDEIPIKTRLLHPYVEQRGIVDQINIFEVDVIGHHIIAQVQTYFGAIGAYSNGDIANIYYAQNQNLCWRRFAVCKEMYHCMIDRLPNSRVNTLASLSSLLSHLAVDTTSVTGGFPPFTSEKAAELYSLETLFPLEFRLRHEADYRSGQVSDTDLATMYRIPLQYVQIGFDPNYMQAIRMLRGRLLQLD
ncbi:MAG: hypothetical protein FJX25_06330 [Alphaproteobacteria bacterium]|nr:hypothetical protein [Alphaproteobacteria bacterium]